MLKLKFKVVFERKHVLDVGTYLFGVEQTDGSLSVLAYDKSPTVLKHKVRELVNNMPSNMFARQDREQVTKDLHQIIDETAKLQKGGVTGLKDFVAKRSIDND